MISVPPFPAVFPAMPLSQSLRQQIDACREHSGDLALPALAELAEALHSDREVADELARSQRFDRCVHSAMNDLPVPECLAERLIASIDAAQPPSLVSLPSSRRFRVSRRSALLAAGSLALVALLAFGVYQLLSTRQTVAQAELSGEVGRWLTGLDLKMWRPIGSSPLPNGVVIDQAIAARALQWQDVSPAPNRANWAPQVTAIDIAPAGRPKAYLFVVRSRTNFAVPAAPTTTSRLSLSRGFAATAWQRSSAGILYVLVVEED